MLSLPSDDLRKPTLKNRAGPLHHAGRRARFALGSRLGVRHVEGLGRTHYNDAMLASTRRDHVEAYRRDASAFIAILDRAIKAAGRDWANIWSCLDVGCGYGRIVRDLVGKLPPHAISVCDVIDEAARFTAAEFGARHVPVVEMTSPHRNGCYDLVYLLSVYTELDRPMIEMNLAKVAAMMKPNGLVAFTTAGRPDAEMLGRDRARLDLSRIGAVLEDRGFAYLPGPYAYAQGGRAWILPDEVMTLVGEVAPDLEFVEHDPRGFAGREDVFVYRKREPEAWLHKMSRGGAW